MTGANAKNFIPSELYKPILDQVPICTVDLIFFNPEKSKTLLFCRNNEPLKGVYYSIGGRLNKDESFMECVIRQAKREVGLLVDPQKVFFGGVQKEDHPNSAFDGISYSAVNLFYGYILEEENPALLFDEQHSVSKWFDVNDPTLNEYLKSKIKETLLNL